MARLSLAFLGPFQAILASSPIKGFESDKVRALLAYLVVEAGQPHRRESLAAIFWPEQPQEVALKNLRHVLYKLRQVLGEADADNAQRSPGKPASTTQGKQSQEQPPYLLVTTQSVQFSAAADFQLDVIEFVQLVEACRAHNHRRIEACRSCYGRLKRAAELYRGSFLTGFALADSIEFEEWMLLQREKLHREALDVLALLAQLSEAQADYASSLLYARRQIELEPWREEAHVQAMRVLLLLGQRSAAMSQYAACRRVLQEEFGVAPSSETEALYSQIRAADGTSPLAIRHSLLATRHNLPAELTPFVGRISELDEISGLLERPDYRLVTLVGSGGTGKTRLGIQAARSQLGCFRDGVYFVSLQQFTTQQQIAAAISEAIGLNLKGKEEPEAQLRTFLASKEMLLVLDNFEHLLGGAGLLSHLLKESPGVSLLVTSREPLSLSAETTLTIEGLPYPHTDPNPHYEYGAAQQRQKLAERISNYDAVQLFLERAQRVKRDFRISAETAEGVAQLSEQVAGIPLGLELAAAWVHQFTPAQIAASIAQNYDFLVTRFGDVPEQHRSLRAVFNYSWSLLTTEEQATFAHLSVFRGGWDAQATETVVGVPIEALGSLVAKSLLTVVGRQEDEGWEASEAKDNNGTVASISSQGVRFDMHEMLRQYAAEQESKREQEKREVQVKHATYYTTLAAELVPHLEKASGTIIRPRLRKEMGNFIAALEWAISSREQELALRLVVSLSEIWRREGTVSEGRKWTDAALALGDSGSSADPASRALRAQVLNNAAAMARAQGDHDHATLLLEESLSISRELGDPYALAEALNTLGGIEMGRRNYDHARALYGESLSYLQGDETLKQQCWVRANMAICWVYVGQPDKAIPLLQESLAGFERVEDQFGTAYALAVLGEAMRVSGDYEQAISYRKLSLARYREIDNKPYIGLTLSNLSICLQEGGYRAEAVPVLKEALPLVRATGMKQVMFECLASGIRLAASYGELHIAVRLLGALQSLLREYSSKVYTEIMNDLDPTVPQLREAVPSQVWDSALEEGASWMLDRAWAEVNALIVHVEESMRATVE